MNSEAFLSLLQFSDGLCPVGSYAHSFGLESYVSNGTVRNAEGVRSFLLSYLQGSVGPTDAIAAIASRKVALSDPAGAMQRCRLIDTSLDAMKPASELRDASRQMGRQILRIAASLDGSFGLHPLVADLLRTVENAETPGHHAMAFGVVGATVEWPAPEMAYAYLYSTCAGLVAAALRLLPMGQLAGQRILWSLAPAIHEIVEAIKDADMPEVWSFSPGMEIAAMRHATLDARLFRS